MSAVVAISAHDDRASGDRGIASLTAARAPPRAAARRAPRATRAVSRAARSWPWPSADSTIARSCSASDRSRCCSAATSSAARSSRSRSSISSAAAAVVAARSRGASPSWRCSSSTRSIRVCTSLRVAPSSCRATATGGAKLPPETRRTSVTRAQLRLRGGGQRGPCRRRGLRDVGVQPHAAGVARAGRGGVDEHAVVGEHLAPGRDRAGGERRLAGARAPDGEHAAAVGVEQQRARDQRELAARGDEPEQRLDDEALHERQSEGPLHVRADVDRTLVADGDPHLPARELVATLEQRPGARALARPREDRLEQHVVRAVDGDLAVLAREVAARDRAARDRQREFRTLQVDVAAAHAPRSSSSTASAAGRGSAGNGAASSITRQPASTRRRIASSRARSSA